MSDMVKLAHSPAHYTGSTAIISLLMQTQPWTHAFSRETVSRLTGVGLYPLCVFSMINRAITKKASTHTSGCCLQYSPLQFSSPFSLSWLNRESQTLHLPLPPYTPLHENREGFLWRLVWVVLPRLRISEGGMTMRNTTKWVTRQKKLEMPLNDLTWSCAFICNPYWTALLITTNKSPLEHNALMSIMLKLLYHGLKERWMGMFSLPKA